MDSGVPPTFLTPLSSKLLIGSEEKFPDCKNDTELLHQSRLVGIGSRAIVLLCIVTLRAKLGGAVYCNRSCLFVCNGRAGRRAVWVFYHDNSKLRTSILTKLSL